MRGDEGDYRAKISGIRMLPKRKYTIELDIKNIRKAEATIVEPEDPPTLTHTYYLTYPPLYGIL